tara:strand:- start:85 stop:1629 length:1545 start_codon:yes stop_codon:yes gene_type:complete
LCIVIVVVLSFAPPEIVMISVTIDGATLSSTLSGLQRTEREHVATELLTRRGGYLSSVEAARATHNAHYSPQAAEQLRRDARRAPWPSGAELLDALAVVHGAALRPYEDPLGRTNASLPLPADETMRMSSRLHSSSPALDHYMRDRSRKPPRALAAGPTARTMSLSPQSARHAMSLSPQAARRPTAAADTATVVMTHLPSLAIDSPNPEVGFDGNSWPSTTSTSMSKGPSSSVLSRHTRISIAQQQRQEELPNSYSGRGNLVPLDSTPLPTTRDTPAVITPSLGDITPFWNRQQMRARVDEQTSRAVAAAAMASRLKRLQRQNEIDAQEGSAANRVRLQHQRGSAPHKVVTSPNVHAMRNLLARDIAWKGKTGQTRGGIAKTRTSTRGSLSTAGTRGTSSSSAAGQGGELHVLDEPRVEISIEVGNRAQLPYPEGSGGTPMTRSRRPSFVATFPLGLEEQQQQQQQQRVGLKGSVLKPRSGAGPVAQLKKGASSTRSPMGSGISPWRDAELTPT